MSGRKKFFRILLKIVSWIFSFALITIGCLSLILAQPQQDKTTTPEPQPSLTASPPVSTWSEADLPMLISSFPVPVMSFSDSLGMRFVSGSVSDVTVDGQTGRIATLNWQTPNGHPVILQSIYPASALSVLGSDYHFTASRRTGPALFGSESVFMSAPGAVRIHACTDSALYAVVVPPEIAQDLTTLSRSLQLLSAE